MIERLNLGVLSAPELACNKCHRVLAFMDGDQLRVNAPGLRVRTLESTYAGRKLGAVCPNCETVTQIMGAMLLHVSFAYDSLGEQSKQ